MYAAIRSVGVERVTLSSDAGEPLFPHSVECMRLIRSYMAAFGLAEDELDIVCCRNPARIVGAKALARQGDATGRAVGAASGAGMAAG
jgi:hypothetical protein